MRTILFRGKRIDNGEWIKGSYTIYWTTRGKYHGIMEFKGEWLEVHPDTVSQFTGLTDKDGKQIWEGDVVKKMGKDYSNDPSDYWDSYDERWNNYPDCLPSIETNRDVVVMDRFPVFWLKNEEFGYEGEDLQSPDNYEVIGNIHDNPELL